MEEIVFDDIVISTVKTVCLFIYINYIIVYYNRYFDPNINRKLILFNSKVMSH